MGLGVIIQCETACRRLPRRTMSELAGRPLVDHLLTRLREGATQDAEIVVTGEAEADDLIRWACANELDIYRTPDTDGLSSLVETAWFYELDVIVRVGGQSVFLYQPAIADVVERLLDEGLDYVTVLGLPRGTAPEAISRRALDRLRHLVRPGAAYGATSWPSLRNLVSRYPNELRFAFVLAPPDLRRPEFCLAIEYEQDLARARTLFDRLLVGELPSYEPSLDDLVAILDREPTLGAWHGESGILPSISA